MKKEALRAGVVSWMLTVVSMTGIILFSGFSHAQPQHTPGDPTAFFAPYDALLKAHVLPMTLQTINVNAVDYRSWASDSAHKQAMQLLRQANPALLTTKEQKRSFWINAYNLLTISLIIQESETQSIKKIGGFLSFGVFGPWKDFSWMIGGTPYTLHHIEHDILRPLGDARLHFAINCASLSCPNLRREAYVPERLEEQLHDQTLIFLNDRTKGIRRTKDGLEISKIFDWYEDDFAETPSAGGSLAGWFALYDTPYDAKWFKQHLGYNWALNSIPGREPLPRPGR